MKMSFFILSETRCFFEITNKCFTRRTSDFKVNIIKVTHVLPSEKFPWGRIRTQNGPLLSLKADDGEVLISTSLLSNFISIAKN